MSKTTFFNLLPVPCNGGFRMADYWVWCGSAIRGEDGRYHMFAARWPKAYPFFDGYKVASEVVRASADTPVGPYVFEEVVLPARGAAFWDGRMTHNPTIHKIGDTYALFYIGATYDGPTPTPEVIRTGNVAGAGSVVCHDPHRVGDGDVGTRSMDAARRTGAGRPSRQMGQLRRDQSRAVQSSGRARFPLLSFQLQSPMSHRCSDGGAFGRTVRATERRSDTRLRRRSRRRPLRLVGGRPRLVRDDRQRPGGRHHGREARGRVRARPPMVCTGRSPIRRRRIRAGWCGTTAR